MVFDAGGDPAGATALGRFHDDFSALPAGSLSVYNVINVRRPMSGTAEKVNSLMYELERHSRLSVTGMINNTNLAHLSSADDLWEGYEILRDVSESRGVPVAYTSGKVDTLAEFLSRGPDMRYVGEPLEIRTYMHRDWETFTRYGC